MRRPNYADWTCELCTRCAVCRAVLCLDETPEALCDTCGVVICCGHDDCEGDA